MDPHELTRQVIGCAIEVHRHLGPGLLESAYEACLAREMQLRGLDFVAQWPLPVRYKGARLDCAYRVDLLVANELIVELKAVTQVLPIHGAQILSYMKLAGVRTGLLINFHAPRLKDGLHRYVL